MRIGVLNLALMCIVILLTSFPVTAKTYKIATNSPDGLGWMKKLRAATKDIANRTENRVKFKIYPGGVQGDDYTVLRKMRIGQLHGGVLMASSLTRFYPDLQVYNLPLQFRNQAEVDYVRERMDDRIIKGLNDSGVVSFSLFEVGFAYLLAKKPIQGIDEFRNSKVWVPDGDPIAAKQIQSYGISPIPLSIIDVLAGLQTGLIETVVIPPIAALALQWHNHVEYVTDLPLMYIYSMMSMDKKAFDTISAEDQKVVREVMDGVFSEIDSDNRIANKEAYSALITQGLKEVQPEYGELNSWRNTADKSVDELVDTGELTQESVDIFMEHLRAVRSDGSEKSGE